MRTHSTNLDPQYNRMTGKWSYGGVKYDTLEEANKAQAQVLKGQGVTKLTGAESQELSEGLVGKNSEPVGDAVTTNKPTLPQAGERVKIKHKDRRGTKTTGFTHMVQDSYGNWYEVDKKTYNSLKKGKGFVDGGMLKPLSENSPKPIGKPVNVAKAEYTEAARQTRETGAVAQKTNEKVVSTAEKKEQLKSQYNALKKEMIEAKNSLKKALDTQGANIKQVNQEYRQIRAKFDSVSREYKSVCRQLQYEVGNLARATKSYEAAKENLKKADVARKQATTKPKSPTPKPAVAKPAVVKPAVVEEAVVKPVVAEEVAGTVAKAEPVAQRTATVGGEVANSVVSAEANAARVTTLGDDVSKAVTKTKAGGKAKMLVAVAAISVAVVGSAIAYFANKDKSEQDVTEDVAKDVENENLAEVTGESASGAAVEQVNNNDEVIEAAESVEEVVLPTEAEINEVQSANEADLAQIETDVAEAEEPIVIKPGDTVWNICESELEKKNNRKPSGKELIDAVHKMIKENGLNFEADGYTVIIYPNRNLKNVI